MKARLDALARRLTKLATTLPPQRRRGFRGRMMRLLYGRPHIATDRTLWLVRRLARTAELPEATRPRLTSPLRAAVRELERGVSKVERAVRHTGRLPPAQVQWLWRLYQILYRAQQLASEKPGAWRQRLEHAGLNDPRLVPLRPVKGDAPPDRRATAVDALLDAAAQEIRRLGRKRRLLEAARRFLLDAAAAQRLDARAIRDRRVHIGQALAQIDRLQAAGLSPAVDLLYQARQAHSRGDRARLTAALSAIEAGAIEGGWPEIAQLSGRALDRAWQETGQSRFSPAAQAASTQLSHAQLTSDWVRQRIQAGYPRAHASIPALRVTWGAQMDDATAARVEQYTGRDGSLMTLSAAVAADGCFELGGTVSAVQVVETEQRLIEVRHPTEDLALSPARTVTDIPDAVIDDPRTVLTSLASGTLLARRYLTAESRQTIRQATMNDARLFVLDGSGSMIGPRARMRDALLVAELSTLVARLSNPQRAGNPAVHYAYFNDKMGEFQKVTTAEQAQQAVEEVIATVRLGATDIQLALASSFEHLRIAQREDPDLKRAQIVLVTDGEATIDLAAIEQARASLGDLPIGVSIIALGQENAALRKLAARQRARGEPVFYQFMDDRELEDVEQGRRNGLPIHLPAEQGAAALDREIADVIDEMEQALRPLEAVEVDRASVLEQAVAEVGLTLDGRGVESLRARREALMKDEATLEARFQRWFPGGPASAAGSQPAGEDLEDLGQLAAALLSVAEVLAVGGAHSLERRSDAIEIAERLLNEAGISPWRYADLLRRYPEHCRAGITAVRAAAGERPR